MTIDQWLTKLDPNSFSLTTLIWGLFILGALFLWKKWWPHYEKVIVPARLKLTEQKVGAAIDIEKLQSESEIEKDRRQTVAMEGIYQVLVEMRQTLANLRESDKLLEAMTRMLLDRIDPTADKTMLSRPALPPLAPSTEAKS